MFQTILAFFNKNDAEADKKRMLKDIAKQLNHSKFKFYKVSSDNVLPNLAAYFYNIYKLIAPAQLLFINTPNPAVYKKIIIQSQFTKNQQNIYSELEKTNILQQAKKIPLNELKTSVQNKLDVFMDEFDTEKIDQINTIYNKLIMLIDFCNFDYYFLLRKYDQNIEERDFKYHPKFESIKGQYIIEDLQNFIAVAWGMPLEDDWKDVFSFLKDYRGFDAINLNQWNKLKQRLIILRNQNILDMIIQLSLKDPTFKPTITTAKEHIVETELENIKKNINETLNEIQKKQTTVKTENLLNQIFGTGIVLTLKNYTNNTNITFSKHNVHHYTHYEPLNYLKAFLIEYCKKDLRQFSDLVLIRGKWASASLANPMSNAYHNLLEISNQILKFDASLSEEEELGTKLKNYVSRADRDVEARKIANNLVNDANDLAFTFLKEAATNITEYAKNLKSLLEDYEKKRPELIINWKELDRFADTPIKNQGVTIYKKLFLFISLLKLFFHK